MAYNTGNPIGSTDPRDAADNKENFDRFALSTARTYTDRLGVQRKTVTGTLQDYAAYNSRGVWTTATAYNVNDVWRDGAVGAFYLVLADYTSGASAAADIAGGNVVLYQPKLATTAQALAGTAGVLPDAEQVHAAFKQYGYGGQNPLNDALDCNDLPPGSRNSWDGITESAAVSLNLPALGGSSSDQRSWHVECFGRGATRLVQEATEVFGVDTTRGRTFTRVKQDTTWHPWVENQTTANILGSAGQSTLYPMTQKAVTDALDTKVDKVVAVTGSITLNGTTDNTVVMTDIVTELSLEVGDVIRIDTGTYNKLHTVESITDNSSIIVNYEHAGNRGNGSLKLPDFTGQATVTRIAKWFNAPVGLGQAWIDMKASRLANTVYTNTAGRSIVVIIDLDANIPAYVDGILISQTAAYATTITVPHMSTYETRGSAGVFSWGELR